MQTPEDWIRHGQELRRPLLVHESLGQKNRLCIVGGGLSGLCIAYRIGQKNPNIHIDLIENADQLGGVIETWKDGDWLCDVAVNATRPHPAVWRLVQDLGLQQEFSPSRKEANSRWIWKEGSSHKLSRWTLLKMNPLKLYKGIRSSRKGGASIGEILPNKSIADAMTLGIVNDTSHNVDADFLMPALTKFGPKPPIGKRKLRKGINKSYPLFVPEPGSTASFQGGISTLIDALVSSLDQMKNIAIHLNYKADSLEHVCREFDLKPSAIVWSAGSKTMTQSKLSVFAVGYESSSINEVPVGYGTLIPDESVPISGILHESDVHATPRAPQGHRLFRIMVPHERWDGEEASVKQALRRVFTKANPVLFTHIGERSIPRYLPGHLQSIAKKKSECSQAGWSVSGVSITHVVDQAERIAELF